MSDFGHLLATVIASLNGVRVTVCIKAECYWTGFVWLVYLQEPWSASARRAAPSCSHCPSPALRPGPSGCWCHCTAAGSPGCRSLSARWCSWCPGLKKTHSTCGERRREKERPTLVHVGRNQSVEWDVFRWIFFCFKSAAKWSAATYSDIITWLGAAFSKTRCKYQLILQSNCDERKSSEDLLDSQTAAES